MKRTPAGLCGHGCPHRLPGLKGIVTSRIALLDNRDCDPRPKVKILMKGDFAS